MDSGSLERYRVREDWRATLLYAIGECGVGFGVAAEEMGVHITTLTGFLNGRNLRPEMLEKVGLWCVEYGVVQSYPEQAALAALVAGLPLAQRNHAREVLARWYRGQIMRAGLDMPAWIYAELYGLRFLRRRR